MTGVEEQVELVSLILNGHISYDEVRKKLDDISIQYGDGVFNSYEVKKKPKPWTESDLRELEILSASGAGSKEFYLYLSEVSDYIKKQKSKKKIVTMAIIGFAVLATIIVTIVML